MTASALHVHDVTHLGHVDTIDMKLEVLTLPVSDVDRAKAFYAGLGWRLDADVSHGDGRVVQFTPPGSECSVHFGRNVTPAAPGSAQNMYLIVSDLGAARAELAARGVEVSEVFHYADGPARFGGEVRGPAPDQGSYASYASFRDPDGNRWLLQEITTRFPGRLDRSGTAFTNAADLASAMRRASMAHNAHEQRIGHADTEGWPEWYASYMVAEQSGAELPT
jgi:catechol 2,3-dioxygenase-like lactoylglutathione lyase family enzyme